MFPSEEARSEFSAAVNGFISGNYWTPKLYQYNLIYPLQWSLQKYINDEWRDILTTNQSFKIPFIPVRYEIWHNQ